LAAQWLVCLFGAPKRDASKNREMGGALDLGGRLLMMAYNNQPRISGSNNGDVSVLGACWGTEELGWNERSRKKLRDVRQQSNGFENYEL